MGPLLIFDLGNRDKLASEYQWSKEKVRFQDITKLNIKEGVYSRAPVAYQVIPSA